MLSKQRSEIENRRSAACGRRQGAALPARAGVNPMGARYGPSTKFQYLRREMWWRGSTSLL
jgi:hypothetical protein